MDVVNELISQAATSPWLLPIVFALTIVDGFFPPMPSETVLVAGIAVAASASDPLSVVLLCLVAALGAAIGDNIAYSIGHGVGSTRFRWMRTPRSAATIGRARHALDRRPAPLLLAGRFIPVGRVVINMTAGALRFPRRRFIPLCLVSALSWAVFSAVIGIFAGRWRSGSPLLSALLGTLLALGIGLLIERIHSLRGRSSGATAG